MAKSKGTRVRKTPKILAVVNVVKIEDPDNQQVSSRSKLNRRDLALEPTETHVARFWHVYHSEGKEYQKFKEGILKQAKETGLVINPEKQEHIDDYFYALYKVASPKPLAWFFKTFFQKAN